MKRWKKVLLTAVPATLALSFTSLAGEWYQDMNGWRYENEDGSYCRNGWYWLDGNEDGLAECYCFTNDGYLVQPLYNLTGMADNHEVNQDGAWVVDGVVQQKTVEVKDTNDPAALEVYMAAQEKNSELDSIDTDAQLMMVMTAEDTSIDVGMNMNMKARGATTGDVEFVAEGNMDMMGSDLPFQMFYTDGYYYIDMMGMKMKQAMPIEEAMEEVAGSMDMVEFEQSLMKNLTMVKEGENTVLTYDVNINNMTDFLNDAIDGAVTSDEEMTISYDINAASGKVVIDENGYYVSEEMTLDMVLNMENVQTGESINMGYVMDIVMNINNPGEEVTFTLPSTEGYTDVSESLI